MTVDHLVSLQIRRPLRTSVQVARRCHLGLPVVVVCPPRLDDGTPFPTRYWLTCPVARAQVAWLEAGGGVARARRWVEADPRRQEALQEAHARHRRERDRALGPEGGPRPEGGIGGTRAPHGIKCLHAHLADHWAGHPSPVGEWVAGQLPPPACEEPCVPERPSPSR
ncbi:MAG: DUF501 domain-containing protein [Myxococcota bacterium]